MLEDQYFTTNFKDTLQKSIFTYQKFKVTNTTVIKHTIAVKDINGKLKDRIILGEDLVLKIFASSANDETITKFNIDRILLNGISYDYKIIDSGDNWIEISFDSLKGVSGIKTITFLDGYAVDQNGHLSEQFSVAFRYYGYDLTFLIIIAIFSVMFPIYCYKKYR